MEISELSLKLIIILIPGAIASRIYQKVTIHEKWTSFQFVANAILFGSISYLLTELFLEWKYNDLRLLNFWNDLPTSKIPYDIVLKACITATIIGIVISTLDHYKILNWIAKLLKVSNKYGDENLYSYFLNAKNVKEVYVRDLENNSTYHGMIDSYSETDDTCEIVLWDVAVYSNENTSDLLYLLDKVYLSRPKNNITIELPIKKENNGETTTTPETTNESN